MSAATQATLEAIDGVGEAMRSVGRKARAAAGDRLAASLVAMRAVGLDATGEVGDGDPVRAIEDALRTFRPDELVVSTHPPGRSNWLERGVVERARERFELPLTHVVVDLESPPG